MASNYEEQYDPAMAAGGFNTNKLATFNAGVSITGSNVTGANSTQKGTYASLGVNTNGTTAVNLFPTGSTAPTIGTLTSIGITANDTTKGTIDLISNQGTLVRMIKNGTLGGFTGSFITPIVYQAGSLLQVVSAGTDNAAVEAVYYTFA